MPMTHDGMVAVILAHKNGAKIQKRAIYRAHRRPPDNWAPVWENVSDPGWDFHGFEYREKPNVPPVAKWRWVMKCNTGHMKVSDGYFSEHEDIYPHFDRSWYKVQKIDHTLVYVEE